MQLLYSPMSPFARKVRVAAHEVGVPLEIAMINPWTDEALRKANPLAKVPTVILDDGTALYDSRVICQYLDGLSGGRLVPAPRWPALLLEAIADGVGDAAVRAVMEKRRDEGDRHLDVIERQFAALDAALDRLEAERLDGFGLGEIAVAAHLGYLDFRSVVDWRAGRPGLAAWYEAASRRDSMVATEPVQM